MRPHLNNYKSSKTIDFVIICVVHVWNCVELFPKLDNTSLTAYFFVYISQSMSSINTLQPETLLTFKQAVIYITICGVANTTCHKAGP